MQKSLSQGIYAQSTQSSRKNYYDYDDILLKTFFDIIHTGDLKLLKKNKGRVNINLEVLWESIIKKHNDANGNFGFNNYIESIRSYAYLLAEYTVVKAAILKLTIKLDLDTVLLLKEKDYLIDFTTADKFRETLHNANLKSNNLITKIMTRQKEIESFNSNNKGEPLTFAKALMGLGTELGYSIARDITLAEFDEGKRIIKKRHGRNNNTR